MPLALFPEVRKGRVAALYAISPDEPDEGKILPFKVGLTSHFRSRLNSYQTCFNDGFYVYALLPLQPSIDRYATKEEKIALRNRLLRLEDELMTMMKDYNWKTSTRVNRSEWLKMKQAKLKEFSKNSTRSIPKKPFLLSLNLKNRTLRLSRSKD